MTSKLAALLLASILLACGSPPKDASGPAAPLSAEPQQPSVESRSTDTPSAPSKAEPEEAAACEKDADCTIFADCCSCRAVSAKAPLPPSCDGICGESKCEVKGKTLDNVACVAGHCKLK